MRACASGAYPAWIPQLASMCPFLFTFEARSAYLHSHAFGYSRALTVRCALPAGSTKLGVHLTEWVARRIGSCSTSRKLQRFQERSRPTAGHDDVEGVRISRISRQKVG